MIDINKLAPKIKVSTDKDSVNIMIDEFLTDEELNNIKIILPNETRGIGSRIVNYGCKGGKPQSKELF